MLCREVGLAEQEGVHTYSKLASYCNFQVLVHEMHYNYNTAVTACFDLLRVTLCSYIGLLCNYMFAKYTQQRLWCNLNKYNSI